MDKGRVSSWADLISQFSVLKPSHLNVDVAFHESPCVHPPFSHKPPAASFLTLYLTYDIFLPHQAGSSFLLCTILFEYCTFAYSIGHNGPMDKHLCF